MGVVFVLQTPIGRSSVPFLARFSGKAVRFYLLVKLKRKPIGIEKTTMPYLILQEPFEAGGSSVARL